MTTNPETIEEEIRVLVLTTPHYILSCDIWLAVLRPFLCCMPLDAFLVEKQRVYRRVRDVMSLCAVTIQTSIEEEGKE
jgi:hypothetical protein